MKYINLSESSINFINILVVRSLFFSKINNKDMICDNNKRAKDYII